MLIDECLLLEETADNHDFRQAKARRSTRENPLLPCTSTFYEFDSGNLSCIPNNLLSELPTLQCIPSRAKMVQENPTLRFWQHKTNHVREASIFCTY